MFCKKCGVKQKEDSIFCSNCGEKISDNKNIEIEKVELIKKNKSKNKESESASNLEKVIYFFSAITAFIIGRFLGIVFFIFVIAYFVGDWFPKWYMKKKNINYGLINFIAWSNTLAWLLPPLGILVGFSTLGFSKVIIAENKKYKILAFAGIIISLINSIIGILINL